MVWRLRKNAAIPTIAVGNLQSSGSNSTQLKSPYDVYIDRKRNMYVSEYDGHRVKKYINESIYGMMIAGTGSSGPSLNQINSARYMTFDTTETYMFVVDTFNNRVSRFLANTTAGANGTVVAGGNGAGTTNTQLYQPWGLYVLPTGNQDVFITNLEAHSVVRWDAGALSSTLIAGTPGTSGSNSTLLNKPTGVKVDSYMNVFVGDAYNHRVQMFCFNNRTGRTIAGTRTVGSSATQLDQPLGIAFDSAMNLYVSDSNNRRVQKFVRL